MSKKLLMNNFASNGLMPVQDGLIFWLDAIDFDNTTKTLKDRITGTTVEFSEGEKLIKGYNCIKCSEATTNYAWVSWSDIISDRLYDFSIDVCLKDTLLGCKTQMFFEACGERLQDSYTEPGLWFDSFVDSEVTFHRRAEVTNRSSSVADIILNENFSAVGLLPSNPSIPRLFVNGTNNIRKPEGVHTFVSSITTNSKMALFGRKNATSYAFNGDFNSIRIYNRILTEDEIKQNYEYDKSIQRG